MLLPVKENGVVITMACSNSYKTIMGVLLQSIVENASQHEYYDIVILEYDMPVLERSRIKSYYQADNVSIRFLNVKQALDQFDLYVRDYFSIMTYARLLIPQIFAAFQRVLYLDCDMVCVTDVAKLYRGDMQGMSLLAVPDAILNMEAWTNPNSMDTRQYLENVVGVKAEGEYVNGGAIVFDIVAIRREMEDLFTVAECRKWSWVDQDVLNHVYSKRIAHAKIAWNTIVIANFKQRRRYMKRSGLFIEYEKALAEPCIVHYAGEMLPCYRKNVPLEEFFWKYAKGSVYAEELKKKRVKKTSIRRELLDVLAWIFPYDGKARGILKHCLKNR